MKKYIILVVVALLTLSSQSNILAQDDGIVTPEMMIEGTPLKTNVEVQFYDIEGTPITSIQRGNPVHIQASYPEVGPPVQSKCILILPVNSSNYKERAIFSRWYDGSSIGTGYDFYIPGWIQIEGTATAVVRVKGAGVGIATLQVTP